MRILVYISLVFSFSSYCIKKKERSRVQVLDRCRFEQKSCVGARSQSETSKSLQLGATLRERHLEVARLKDVLCSKNALGATSQSEHMKSLQLGATLRERHLEVARVFVVTELKNCLGATS